MEYEYKVLTERYTSRVEELMNEAAQAGYEFVAFTQSMAFASHREEMVGWFTAVMRRQLHSGEEE